MSATVGGHGGTLFFAREFSMEGFGETLALELARFGINGMSTTVRTVPNMIQQAIEAELAGLFERFANVKTLRIEHLTR